MSTTALLSVDSKVDFVYTDPTEFSAQAWRAASNQIQLQIESKQGGILIVSENWMPGWQITNLICDSANCAVKPSPVGNLPAFSVLRANLTFIGIVLPAGEYQFNLVYQPSSVRFGLLISATTLLLILGAGIWRIRRRIR